LSDTKNKIDINPENALILAKCNPKLALLIAEMLERKGDDEKIIEVFRLAPGDTLKFIYKNPRFASQLVKIIPDKVDEIINMPNLPKEELVEIALCFPDKMLRIARKNPDSITLMFFEAMYNADDDPKIEKQKIALIKKKVCEIGQEFPDHIMPILSKIKDSRKCEDEQKGIMIETAKFFPEKAVDIATFFNLEIDIAREVPSVAAKIAIEKPLLAFAIIEAVPASEKEIREHFTLKYK
jgi:hypothetical protein